MVNDRLPKYPVDVDGDIEEMSVQLYPRELLSVIEPERREALLSGRFVLEPWIRVVKGADWDVTIGIEATLEEDDNA